MPTSIATMVKRAESIEQRIFKLAESIDQDTASLAEVIEWLELVSNGNPIKDKAVSKLKTELTSSYGDGYFDGFKAAQDIQENDKLMDLSDYNDDTILAMSESAEESSLFHTLYTNTQTGERNG
ncbi:hypothetical protein [Photobacterium damselae]|uniref:hypothetical protein n=1 Tax=Photobacterium damselae TaxID=38293 RepID=UPI0040696948